MSVTHQQQLDTQMEMVFRSRDPALTRLPHCIFFNQDHPMRIIAEVVKAPLGIWGENWFLDVEGNGYLPPDDGQIVEDFQLWALPENQESACQFMGTNGLPTFVKVDRTASCES